VALNTVFGIADSLLNKDPKLVVILNYT